MWLQTHIHIDTNTHSCGYKLIHVATNTVMWLQTHSCGYKHISYWYKHTLMWLQTHSCGYKHIHIDTNIHPCGYKHINVATNTFMWLQTYSCGYKHIFILIQTYIHVDTNTHIHVDTKTHVATNTFMWLQTHSCGYKHIHVAQRHIHIDTNTHSCGYKNTFMWLQSIRVQSRAAPCAIGASFLWMTRLTHHFLVAVRQLSLLSAYATPFYNSFLTNYWLFQRNGTKEKKNSLTWQRHLFCSENTQKGSVVSREVIRNLLHKTKQSLIQWLVCLTNQRLCFSFPYKNFINITSMIFLSNFFLDPSLLKLADQIAKVWANWPIGLSF